MPPETPISLRLRRIIDHLKGQTQGHILDELIFIADQVQALEAAQYIPVLEPKIRED